VSRRLRELADPAHPYHHAPRGVWLIAGTSAADPYPCMCRGSSSGCGYRCPCRGRTDHLDLMPAMCCARRAAETAVRRAEKESE
jgi:hypothetical protein